MRYALLLTLSLYAFAAHAQWSGAAVDTLTANTVRDENTRQSLAVDDAGTLHAVWQSEQTGGGWRIRYARRPFGGSWSMPAEVAPAGFGSDAALGVHRATGAPAVALAGPTALSDEIFVGKDSAGIWDLQRVTTDTVNDMSSTIAVDRNGRTHVAWISEVEQGVYKIKYGNNIGGTWQVQMLDSSELGPFGSGAEPFIAVTDSGRAHITYRGGDFGTYAIHHAWNTTPGGTSWSYEIVSTPNGNDFNSATVITPDNTLHLLASGNDGFGFPPHAYYLKKTGSAWSLPELANTGHNGWGGSLFIDRHGNAHITSNETSGNFYTGNLYYATNRTGSWVSSPLLTDGATYNGVMAVGIDGRGHALAYNGNTFATQEIVAIHTAGPVTSVGDTPEMIAGQFRLEQNFPNPFNPTTTISYQLSGVNVVTLKVYDLLGREVATLVNGTKEPGNYRVNWNASNLPSGAYIYRLTVDGKSVSKRLMLLK